nr:hypothetical protein BCU03_15875 [Vibrio breoganii]
MSDFCLDECGAISFGFDNDMPGLAQARSFKFLFQTLGYGGNVVVPPLLSRADPEVSMKDVVYEYTQSDKRIKANLGNERFAFHPANIVNDWNDVLRLGSEFDSTVTEFLEYALDGDYPVPMTELFGAAKVVDECRKLNDNKSEPALRQQAKPQSLGIR